MPSRSDRIEGALWGLLIGDALGVPYEFTPPEAMPPLAQIEFDPPAGFPRAHRDTPPGTWSDDGAQALALLASLQERGRLDVDDLGRRFVAWLSSGYMAVDDDVFDCGVQTRAALESIRSGIPAPEAGASGEFDNGNGSLMRVLPLALWHTGTDADLVADAAAQSLPTHGHPRAWVCCALYCLWARHILREAPGDGWNAAVASLHEIYAPGSPEARELDIVLAFDSPSGSGYVVDTLHSARACLARGSYESVVKAAVAMGHDTDTTACVAGGLAGLRDGVDAIPSRWRQRLRGQSLVEPLLSRLLA
ncbi:ADP-ribosylglycohydrolase family protein [Rubricoccus marinus]|uniref:ADP-ribosylglycohydrolase n=1 Tax=Rubricoccus marinus TaxID=716817 RepID=A0A259TX85_9BACT|nr:ADP-ribosylglycohydrolase family protein [Rubricoccus marinus]OZC02310.1 hypothetical protein BSZ36_04555 [Rubricoccus marinus]